MKKIRLSLIMVLFGVGYLSAQNVIDVPPLIDGVPVALNEFILADTASNGSHDADRVYKLQRGATYGWNATLTNIDYNFVITSDADNAVSPIRPAMVASTPNPVDGTHTQQWATFAGTGIKIHLSNVLFQAVGPDLKHGDGTWLFAVSSDDVDLNYNKCIFNGFAGGITVFPAEAGAETVSYVVENCVFRNSSYPNHPFMGQGNVVNCVKMQKMWIINNTFVNTMSYQAFHSNPVDDFRFEHNTIVGNSIQPLWIFTAVNASIKDNIFYACFTFGDTYESHAGGWFGDEVPAIISLKVLDAGAYPDYNEADRKVEITNNVYFQPKKIDDYFQASIDADDGNIMQKPVWVNPSTQAMFDDNDAYPLLVMENNYIDVDPGFTDNTTIDTIINQRIYHNDNFFAGNAWDGTGRDLFIPEVQFNLSWPLPEFLTYTNATILAGSTEGKQVGDLNWYTKPVGVLETSSANNLTLSSYPNPFSEITNIRFELSDAGMTKLNVYNIQGQVVKALVNKEYAAGTHVVSFDASELSSGVYFYKLESNGLSVTNKMIIQK